MNEQEGDQGRGLVLVPDALVSRLPLLKALTEDYRFVIWSDFLANSEEYSDNIYVIMTAPIMKLPLNEQVLRKLPNLRAVLTLGVGVDHLDLPLLRRLGLKVGNTPGAVTGCTADMAFCLLMAAARRIPEQIEAGRGYEDGAKINVAKSSACIGQDIHEATLGIVGMGDIGLEVARRAKGFRMNVLYHNRNPRLKEDEEEVNATYCSTLEELLPRADFLMISAPLTESTKNMMRKERFELMKPTSILINIARGPLVNTDDLVDALRNGTIAGAALDVTDPEPLPDHHPLLHMPNAIVLPHVGGLTTGSMRKVFAMTAENTRAAMEGRRMPGELLDAQMS